MTHAFRRIVFGVFLTLSFGAVAIVAAADRPHSATKAAEGAGLVRWAVLASAEIQETGVPDLLLVELTKQKSLELVEREKLQDVLRELKLDALQNPQSVERRLQLGKALKADALLLLSRQKQADKFRLQLVICECRYGARLHVESVPFDPKRREAAVTHCREKTQQIRERYEGGVRQMVAVPNFVARNLTHRYAHLQSGYARLVEQALLTVPGIAVVEIEEARAIGRELELAGAELQNRPVAQFVEGEFEMSEERPNDPVTVRLKAELRLGKRSEQFARQGVPLNDVPERLLKELVPQILSSAGARSRPEVFSRREQFAALVRRARAFSEMGAFRDCLSLREAALLLEPDDAQQRLMALADRGLLELGNSQHRNDNPEKKPEGWKKYLEAQTEYVDFLERHITHLIHRRLLNPGEGGSVARLLFSAVNATVPHNYYPSPEFRAVRARLFWDMFTRISQLDYSLPSHEIKSPSFVLRGGRPSRAEQESWISVGWSLLQEFGQVGVTWVSEGTYARPQGVFQDEDTLKDLSRFLLELAPETASINGAVVDAIYEGGYGWRKQKRFSPEQLQPFFEKLRDSRRGVNEIYGRYGLLCLKILKEPPDAEMRSEAAALLKTAKDPKWQNELLTMYLQRKCDDLTRKQALTTGKAKKPIDSTYLPYDNIDLSPRVRFKAIVDLVFGNFDTIVRCSDQVDLFWSPRAVSVMRHKGKTESLFFADASSGPIRTVRWTPERVWIVTANDGLRVASIGGGVKRVGLAEGLPLYEVLSVMPLADGRAVVAARVKGASSSYLAIVKPTEGGTYKAEVFHKMSRGSDREKPLVDEVDIRSLTFGLISDPTAKRPAMLVHRGSRDNPVASGRLPLSVDLETLAVTLYRGPYVPFINDPHDLLHFVGTDGRVVEATGAGAQAARPQLGHDFHADVREFTYAHDTTPLLLPFEGWVYQPGTRWLRFDPQLKRREKLTTGPLPKNRWYQHYGVSAHYGLVAWNPGQQLQQVFIDAKDIPPDDPLLAYDYVPAQHRPKHLEAALALRKFGAVLVPSQYLGEPTGTRVILKRNWTGGDDGLKHLGALYRLTDMECVQAPFGNGGMKHIGALSELRYLQLIETKVSDEGIAALRDAPNLESVELEGTVAGQEFGDPCLVHLAAMQKLGGVTLYGLRFTDAAVDKVLSMPKLVRVKWVDTSVTPAAINRARQQRPKVKWYSN